MGRRAARAREVSFKLEEVLAAYGDTLAAKPEGIRRRSQSQEHHYILETAEIDLAKRCAVAERWRRATIKLLATKRTYTPPATACAWRSRRETGLALVGTVAEAS
jgi:uncharacterized protein YifE (UPF0438 family)